MQQDTYQIRDASIYDSDAIVRLNEESVAVTSPMGSDEYLHLLTICNLASVIEFNGEVVAFLLAIGSGRPYDNKNYLWFEERRENFLYIDRVVVDSKNRGSGFGIALYEHLYTRSLGEGFCELAAEIDIDPPNIASLAFHNRHDFIELGARNLENGKRVSMRVKLLR